MPNIQSDTVIKLTETLSDYVNADGDSMTGDLTLANNTVRTARVGIKDDSHYLFIDAASDLDADKTLTIDVNNAGRLISIHGTSAIDQDVRKAAVPTFAGVKSDWYTNAGGTEMIIGAGELSATLHDNLASTTSESVYIGGESGVQVFSSPDNMASGYAGLKKTTLIDTAGDASFANNIYAAGSIRGSKLGAYDGSHYLYIDTAGDLSADRTLTIDTNDVNRTIYIQGTSYINQNVMTTAKPTFVGINSTGDIDVVKNNPWLTLDSSSAGANGVEQAAGITIGESGKKGSAAMHLTYTGDGKGWIGMGTVSATTSKPAYPAMGMSYTSNDVTFAGSVIGPNGAAGSKVDGFEKVFNAVWNDIADFIEVEGECEIEYGKCYYINKEFKHAKTTEIAQKGVLGIASDTYGYGLGMDENKHQLPLAVGGFVLAYVIGDDFEPGDALTSGPDGQLVFMPEEDAARLPHRIVATYYKPQPTEEYHNLKVDGRHWVKVK